VEMVARPVGSADGKVVEGGADGVARALVMCLYNWASWSVRTKKNLPPLAPMLKLS
jgi:hypothetical protein